MSWNCSYSSMLEPELLSDIVLVGDNLSLPAHLAVLASQSKFLKEIFLSSPINEEDTVLIIPEAKDEDLRQMINFLYGKTPKLDLPSELFRRLAVTGGSARDVMKGSDRDDLSDHNRNVLENPEIETAEVLIDNHELFCQSDSPLFCILCNNGFSSEAGLREHLKHHPICVLCNNQFLRNSDLLEHWRSHPQCGICGDRVLNQAALEEHEIGHDNFEDSLATLNTNLSNLVNDPLIDGCQELFQEVNPDLEISSVRFVAKEMDEDFGILLKCDHCEETFDSMFGMENHIAKEHYEAASKQSFDGNDYNDVDTEDYEQVLPSREAFFGNIPTCDFQDQLPVNESISQNNPQPICAICKVTFHKLAELSRHVLKTHPVDRLESGGLFTCKFCAEVGYQHLNELENHYNSQHKGVDTSFRCPDCSREFKTIRFLRTHIRIHLTEKAFQCGLCFSLISTEVSMRAHIRRCNLGTNSQFQRNQAKLTEKKGGLKNTAASSNKSSQVNVVHLQPVEGGLEAKGKRFTCLLCGKFFKDKIRAESHIRRCRTLLAGDMEEIKPQCQSVEEISTIQNLIDARAHISEVEANLSINKPRNHRCQFCEKTFLTLSHLKEHQIQHTRVFPFNCNICARGFKRKNVFENHVCNFPREGSSDGGLDNVKKELIQEMESRENERLGILAPPPLFTNVSSNCHKKLNDSPTDRNADIDMNVIITGTSRSGRLIKQKRFFEDLAPVEERKRRRKRKTMMESNEAVPAVGSRTKCARTSTQCSSCEVVLPSHSALFRHMLVHVPPEVVKTLPVYAEGDTGWCQYCEEPLPVTHADLHMSEKHQELLSHSARLSSPYQLRRTPSKTPRSELLISPIIANSTEENHNQDTSVGNLQFQSERFLQDVKSALEEEEEFCADPRREKNNHKSAELRPLCNLKKVFIKLEKIKISKK